MATPIIVSAQATKSTCASALAEILRLAALSVTFLCILDAALFRTGLYTRVLEPNSYAHRFLTVVRLVRSVARTARKPVLVLGDSRIAEGFSAKVADAMGHGVHFVGAGVPAASLRAWFYILREADPSRDNFSAVVLPVDDYDDEDGIWDRDDVLTDVHIVLPALRVTDIPEFVRSYGKPDARWEVLRDAIFEGLIYRDDIREFLRNPATRLVSVQAHSSYDEGNGDYNYKGHADNLLGLKWDAISRQLYAPNRIDPSVQKQLKEALVRTPAPQTGRCKAYRRYWLNRLIGPYARSETKFLIVRLPRNPLPMPHYARYDAASSIRELRSHAGVIVEDEHTFDHLEQPQYFFDTFHMNAEGRQLFSAGLAELVLRKVFRQR